MVCLHVQDFECSFNHPAISIQRRFPFLIKTQHFCNSLHLLIKPIWWCCWYFGVFCWSGYYRVSHFSLLLFFSSSSLLPFWNIRRRVIHMYIQYIYMRVYTCTYSTYTWYSLPVNTHFKTVPSLHLQGPLICQNYPCSSVAINLSLIFFSLCSETNIYRSYPFVSAVGRTPIKFIIFCHNLHKLDGLHACSLWVYVCDQ